MKKFFLFVLLLPVTMPLLATKPQTPQQFISRPTTPVQKNLAADAEGDAPAESIRLKPKTTASVQRSVSNTTIQHPTTPSVSRVATSPFGGTMDNTKQTSANASYKNAKTLAPSEPPKVNKTAKGESGLGTKDPQAASKEKLAETPKKQPETAQPSLDDVLKKTNLPADLMGKLKQHNFEAAGVAKHGKK